MLPEGYVVLNFEGNKAYIRRDRLWQLRRVCAAVFDCDGVLLDIRDSYNKAISKVVAFVLEGLTGYPFPVDLVSDEIIFLFRKTGGFNNDWDTVYGVLMFVLSGLTGKLRGKLKRLLERTGRRQCAFERFFEVTQTAKEELKSFGSGEGVFEGLAERLKGFASLLDATGAASVDRNLLTASGWSEDFADYYKALKRFLYHSSEVGRSVIPTVFEEFFCGSGLFREMYGIEPRFCKDLGMVENEKVIVQRETLGWLASIFGKHNLGIASGSRPQPAKHVMGDLLGKFRSEALVFLDTMERAERERSNKEGRYVSLKKPHPFSLLKAVEAFDPFDFVLYVGDSMEDAIMAREAAKVANHFLFVGVYHYTGLEQSVLCSFLEAGCDMVIPSVNELPSVLEALRREKR